MHKNPLTLLVLQSINQCLAMRHYRLSADTDTLDSAVPVSRIFDVGHRVVRCSSCGCPVPGGFRLKFALFEVSKKE